jgi:transcription elongation factor GreB
MSRWRPPGAATTPYITAHGYRALEAEARALWSRRREVVVHLAAAAAEGDRSENAEYIYRKKELREIDRRLGYLQRRMPALTIVRSVPEDHTKVFFGALVELEDERGELRRLRIVGGDEADAGRGEISIDAPVARALLGRALDDEVALGGDGGTRERCVIVAITYPDPEA